MDGGRTVKNITVFTVAVSKDHSLLPNTKILPLADFIQMNHEGPVTAELSNENGNTTIGGID